MNICIIPARGGSKRIPRKNIRDFCGRPMIGWSIRVARESGLFDRVIVSTDDDEIAGIAESEGAEVPFRRPEELANDHAGTIPVIAHGVAWLAEQGVEPDAVCCLYPTAPFCRAEDLAAGHSRLAGVTPPSSSEAVGQPKITGYAFSAARFPAPVQRGFTQTPEGGLQMLFPEQFNRRSQDLEPVYHDAGQFYWARPETWAEGAPIFGPDSAMVVLPPERVCDIDEPGDWARAEALFRALQDG